MLRSWEWVRKSRQIIRLTEAATTGSKAGDCQSCALGVRHAAAFRKLGIKLGTRMWGNFARSQSRPVTACALVLALALARRRAGADSARRIAGAGAARAGHAVDGRHRQRRSVLLHLAESRPADFVH